MHWIIFEDNAILVLFHIFIFLIEITYAQMHTTRMLVRTSLHIIITPGIHKILLHAISIFFWFKSTSQPMQSDQTCITLLSSDALTFRQTGSGDQGLFIWKVFFCGPDQRLCSHTIHSKDMLWDTVFIDTPHLNLWEISVKIIPEKQISISPTSFS